VKSPSGYHYKLREVLRGLGLRRLHHEVLRLDTPAVRGMVRKVGHLVRVQEVQ
jgi:large subunit ribosomal protein L30